VLPVRASRPFARQLYFLDYQAWQTESVSRLNPSPSRTKMFRSAIRCKSNRVCVQSELCVRCGALACESERVCGALACKSERVGGLGTGTHIFTRISYFRCITQCDCSAAPFLPQNAKSFLNQADMQHLYLLMLGRSFYSPKYIPKFDLQSRFAINFSGTCEKM
jgi:hypothetical protein